ncbi:hypothetical protein M758_2G191400 [Ceratodon purpureus]|nr:hypothetical protein M758_2G191400 [Ceratodon purpureus]
MAVAFALAVKIGTSYGLPWDPKRAALAGKEWRTGSIRIQFLIIHRRYLLPSDVHRSPRSEDFPEKAEIASEAQSWLISENIISSRSLVVRRGSQYVKGEVGHSNGRSKGEVHSRRTD